MRIYDIHFHAFNFTHVNFTAFLHRYWGSMEKLQELADKTWLKSFLPIVLPIGSLLYRDKLRDGMARLRQIDNFLNLSFILSQDLNTYLDNIEQETEKWLQHAVISGEKPHSITLVPLIMDFTDPGFTSQMSMQYAYSGKEVVKQTTDLLHALKNRSTRPGSRINYLPFLGLNPFNYSMEDDVSIYTRLKLTFKNMPEVQDGRLQYDSHSTMLVWTGGRIEAALLRKLVAHSRIEEERLKLTAEENKRLRKLIFDRLAERVNKQLAGKSPRLEDLLHQYFGAYAPNKEDDFYRNQNSFENLQTAGSNIFGGIKLYPPLGFDPWPAYRGMKSNNVALKKLNLLYSFCEKKQIPITVHCSSGGFKTMPEELHLKFTSPARWRQVLKYYPMLKINFAHCGVQKPDMNSHHEWKRIIFREFIIEKAYPNVFADVSYLLSTRHDFAVFKEGMKALKLTNEEQKKVGERLLFGTDFSVSLRESNSYSDQLKLFQTDRSVFTKHWNKKKLMHENPRRFLFGE